MDREYKGMWTYSHKNHQPLELFLHKRSIFTIIIWIILTVIMLINFTVIGGIFFTVIVWIIFQKEVYKLCSSYLNDSMSFEWAYKWSFWSVLSESYVIVGPMLSKALKEVPNSNFQLDFWEHARYPSEKPAKNVECVTIILYKRILYHLW